MKKAKIPIRNGALAQSWRIDKKPGKREIKRALLDTQMKMDRIETLKVLEQNPAIFYYQEDLPEIFQASDSYLFVMHGTNARSLGRLLENVGYEKEYRRVWIVRKDKKKTRSWRAVYVKR